MSIPMYDPEASTNPQPREIEIQKTNGEVVTLTRFRHERKVAQATLERTTIIGEWGPAKHRQPEEDNLDEYREDN